MKPKRKNLHDHQCIGVMADHRAGTVLISFERDPGPGQQWKHRTYRRPFNNRWVRRLVALLWNATYWQLADTRPTLTAVGFRTYIRKGARVFNSFEKCEKEND